MKQQKQAATKNSYKAYGDYVLVEPIVKGNTTASGIILPGDEEDETVKGKGVVVSVGALVQEIAIGATVVFKKHQEHEVDALWGVKNSDIIAVLS